VTTIERAIRWKGRVHPSHPQPRSRGYPERVRMSALEFRLAETLGARRSRDGVRGRDGVLSSFLDTSRVAIRPISRFFFQLRIRCFMPRWCFRCVLLRAKDETLRLAKLDRSSLGATADGSSGFMSVAITKPTKEISQSNHSESYAGAASPPDLKTARTRLGTRSGRCSGAPLQNE
jgi:hypothetical protein